MPKKRINVDCPYCGSVNSYFVELGENGWIDQHMHTCDLEEGGCDIPFVVTGKVFVETKAVKVEWGKDEYPNIENLHQDDETA